MILKNFPQIHSSMSFGAIDESSIYMLPLLNRQKHYTQSTSPSIFYNISLVNEETVFQMLNVFLTCFVLLLCAWHKMGIAIDLDGKL